MKWFKKFFCKIVGVIYRFLIKPILFLFDPEKIHDHAIFLGSWLSKHTFLKKIIARIFVQKHSSLEQTVAGIFFPNPIGLAAGFDKNADLVSLCPALGFGFEEIGSITAEASVGNPKPRLWRFPESHSLLVWYGLKNEGAEYLRNKLNNVKNTIPLGINIAKTNSPHTVSTENAIADYVVSFKIFEKIGDYITLNISCPNSFGGEPFVNSEKLSLLLEKIYSEVNPQKPLFIKLPPDISSVDLNGILQVVNPYPVTGFIVGNLGKHPEKLKIEREELARIYQEKGGFSGKAVFDISNLLLAQLYQKTKDRYVLIGCGGVFSAEDAYIKIRLGATLVQLITGMIFNGPQLIAQINAGLAELLKRDNFSSIKEAIGIDVIS